MALLLAVALTIIFCTYMRLVFKGKKLKAFYIFFIAVLILTAFLTFLHFFKSSRTGTLNIPPDTIPDSIPNDIPSNNNNKKISESTCALVENYINEQYGKKCKIKDSTFENYDYGITGGLFQYYFIFVDEDKKEFYVSYVSYIDLSEETLNHLVIEEKE